MSRAADASIKTPAAKRSTGTETEDEVPDKELKEVEERRGCEEKEEIAASILEDELLPGVIAQDLFRCWQRPSTAQPHGGATPASVSLR